MKTSEEIELKGHIIDSLTLPKVLDTIMDMEGDFEILELKVGKTKVDESYCKIYVQGSSELFDELEALGAILPRKEATVVAAPRDKVLPDNFYGTTHHPTQTFINGEWKSVEDLEMDCIITIEDGKPICKRQGLVKKGDPIIVGSEGIKVEAPERSRQPQDIFGFMSSDVSPEKPIISYTRSLAQEMYEIRQKKGSIIFVVGTAMAHTGADEAIVKLIEKGYIHVLFTGNGFSVMDTEKQLFGTSLGMDKVTGKVRKRGYKSHLVAINEIWKAGNFQEAVKQGVLKGGVIHACITHDVPFVIGGSLRDDGPLPDTITDTMVAQDEMRKHIVDADMCIICASMLHGIAVGNMLPSRVKTVAIDINPYVVTRLQDRGTTQALGLVTDPAILMPQLVNELEKLEE